MTKLSGSDEVTRETEVLERGRPLIVTLTKNQVILRRKKTHEEVRVDLEAVWSVGWKIVEMEAKRLKRDRSES